jgi:hypothetical protein
MTANRALILAIACALAVETAIYYSLPLLGANGSFVLAIELIWLCVAVVLGLLFVDRYEHEGSDDRGD